MKHTKQIIEFTAPVTFIIETNGESFSTWRDLQRFLMESIQNEQAQPVNTTHHYDTVEVDAINSEQTSGLFGKQIIEMVN